MHQPWLAQVCWSSVDVAPRPVAAALCTMPGGPGGYPTTAAPPAQQSEHLRWLCAKDQRVLCRAECAAALREESKLDRELCATIEAYRSTVEHCRCASENDPSWFTLDVQNCHARRVAMLQEALAAIRADPPPVPAETSTADTIRGAVYAGYSHTAEATSKVVTPVAGSLQDNLQAAPVTAARLAEHGHAAAVSARSAFASLSQKLPGLSAAVSSEADQPTVQSSSSSSPSSAAASSSSSAPIFVGPKASVPTGAGGHTGFTQSPPASTSWPEAEAA
eukprot:gnl/TRDRNA2_/TRDRNA2_34541_c0_seq1.p1 gnl/TRDRNA2_/TRDRNA2_34541_c0~~gnl/TRDRNA2_/TRDRNA2_34541_c0_seq1.p1  ORF type:complete len:277 (+),score=40.69 gnl/TRDRNA2_/TRDRNA2_34541_c0_seq1:3-833(+)